MPGYTRSDDCELVRACSSRDRDALHELYRRYGATVYNAATVMAKRPTSPPADDLTVAAFTTIWLKAGELAGSKRPVLGQLLAYCGRYATRYEPEPEPALSSSSRVASASSARSAGTGA